MLGTRETEVDLSKIVSTDSGDRIRVYRAIATGAPVTREVLPRLIAACSSEDRWEAKLEALTAIKVVGLAPKDLELIVQALPISKAPSNQINKVQQIMVELCGIAQAAIGDSSQLGESTRAFFWTALGNYQGQATQQAWSLVDAAFINTDPNALNRALKNLLRSPHDDIFTLALNRLVELSSKSETVKNAVSQFLTESLNGSSLEYYHHLLVPACHKLDINFSSDTKFPEKCRREWYGRCCATLALGVLNDPYLAKRLCEKLDWPAEDQGLNSNLRLGRDYLPARVIQSVIASYKDGLDTQHKKSILGVFFRLKPDSNAIILAREMIDSALSDSDSKIREVAFDYLRAHLGSVKYSRTPLPEEFQGWFQSIIDNPGSSRFARASAFCLLSVFTNSTRAELIKVGEGLLTGPNEDAELKPTFMGLAWLLRGTPPASRMPFLERNFDMLCNRANARDHNARLFLEVVLSGLGTNSFYRALVERAGQSKDVDLLARKLDEGINGKEWWTTPDSDSKGFEGSALSTLRYKLNRYMAFRPLKGLMRLRDRFASETSHDLTQPFSPSHFLKWCVSPLDPLRYTN